MSRSVSCLRLGVRAASQLRPQCSSGSVLPTRSLAYTAASLRVASPLDTRRQSPPSGRCALHGRSYATTGGQAPAQASRASLFAAFDQLLMQQAASGQKAQLPDNVFLRLNALLDLVKKEAETGGGAGPTAQYAPHVQGLTPAEITRLGNSLIMIRDKISEPEVGKAAQTLAARLYAVAAEQGDHNAAYAYGQLLRQGGQGVERDPAKAEELLTGIAKRGHPWAQYALGVMCFRGESGPPDFSKALSLLKTAAANGVAPAFNLIGIMHGEGKGVDADPKAAFEWFQKGANAGDAHAHMSLARYYESGKGVEKSFDDAFKHHLTAAEMGLPSAKFNVGNHYFMGKGVGQSFEKAVEWYKKAADLGFAFAQVNLGNMYVEGRGVERDLHRARDLYAAAAASGDSHAKLLLLEVESDIRKAEKEASKA